MSLIEQIINNDLENCQEAMRSDTELKELETRFYEVLKCLDDELQVELEDITSRFNARTARICYINGITDANRLLVDLKSSPVELLEKYSG
jgi:DNA replication initiation complex subunit (GINS family)